MSQQHKVARKPRQEKERVQKATATPAATQAPAPAPALAAERQDSPLASAGPAVAMPPPVQKEVAVGGVDDAAEQEANQVADKVTAGEKAPAVAKLPATPGEKAPAVARAAAPGPAPGAAAQEKAAARAVDQKGSGKPMAPQTRNTLEKSMGTDLGNVRVHDDATAQQSARDLGARAFTHGSDIWMGPGESQSDVGLMAHEAAHAVQQGNTVRRVPTAQQTADQSGAAAQPGGPQGAAPAIAADVRQRLEALPLETGRLVGNDTLRFSSIPIPGFKAGAHRGPLYTAHLPLKRKKAYNRGEPKQRNKWKENMGLNTTVAETALKAKFHQAYQRDPGPAETVVMQGKTEHGAPSYYFGDLKTVATELTLPNWDAQGAPHGYDVDHIVELQLADWDNATWGNDLDNMELLDSSTNSSSGSFIDSRVDDKARAFITASSNALGLEVADLKRQFNFEFEQFAGGEGGDVGANLYWRRDQIQAGQHLAPVQVRSPSDLGGPGHVRIFGGHSGQGKQFSWPGNITADERDWMAPYKITAKQFDTEHVNNDLGTLTFEIRGDDPQLEAVTDPATVQRVPGSQYAGFIEKDSVRARLRRLRAKHFSPVRIDDVDIGPQGLYVAGAIVPEAPFFRGASLGFLLEGGDLQVFKEFNTGDFQVPRPFQVSNSSLTLAWGTRSGLSLRGQVDFGVQRLGQGFLRASASSREGFGLEGQFNFDTNLFDQAEVGMWYRRGAFGGSGDLRIGPGKVRGIRSGSLHVEFGEGQPFRLSGTVQPAIPGVQEGTIQAEYSESEGLLVGGSLQLSDRIPGLRGGRVEVRLRQTDDGYDFAARGTAEPRIPGVNSTITVGYENGIFVAEGSASYERGLLSGQVQIGVTNGPIPGPVAGSGSGATGAPPAAPAPAPAPRPARGGGGAEQLRAYGGGQVTLRLTPWLQGTVGVRLLPNGEIEVSGEVGLPAALNLFDAKEFNRNLFRTPPIDIPILGVAAAGQRIGIFLTLSGGLDANASIGPGQLRELALGVTYNPDHPDQARVTGRAQLHIPAEAGLRLFIRGGIGAGIPIVSASANLEIGGRLGLAGALNAGVQVDWTPTRGLVLDAAGEIMVQPRFTFDITAMVLVEANLGITSIELYSHRWNLASFQYGTDMQFGLRFPVHYEEGKPFNISLNDIQFVAPEINPLDMARGLMRRLTGPATA
jgi:hypothetical protein